MWNACECCELSLAHSFSFIYSSLEELHAPIPQVCCSLFIPPLPPSLHARTFWSVLSRLGSWIAAP